MRRWLTPGEGDCPEAQADRIRQGDRRSIARALSWVESHRSDERRAAVDLLSCLYPHTGRAYRVGVTGPPGTGKSTLISQLARVYRGRDERVGIIAVDPSSPHSGGAVLGDRIRMRDLAGDPGVFVRSMATRGAAGGLAGSTSDAVDILDAAGYDTIFIETVGVGQDEVEIARVAQTVVVVDAPGLGDDIQAIKAGLTEIADILVVNKADRDGADQTVRSYQMVLESARASRPAHDDMEREAWQVPVCRTVAIDGSGIADLASCIDAHRSYLERSGRLALRERERVRAELEMLLRRALLADFEAGLEPGKLDSLVARIALREMTTYQALQELGIVFGRSDRES